MYLLWGIGDVIEDYPRVIQLVLNWTISTLPLGPPLSRAEVDVTIYLLLLNEGDTREDITVAVCISGIDIPNPLINVIQRSQMLVPLNWHSVLCRGVKVRMCLRVPEIVTQYADRNFTLKI